MEHWPSRIGIAATTIFIAVSMTINAQFYFSQGSSQEQGLLFAGLSLGADAFKAVLLVLAAAAWTLREYVLATSRILFFGVLCVFGLVAGFGCIHANHSSVSREAEQRARAVVLAEEAVKRIRSELAGVAASRAKAVVASDIAAAQIDPNWQRSAQCVTVRTDAQRLFCQRYASLMREQGLADERTKLNQALQAAIKLETEARSVSGSRSEDAIGEWIGSWFGWSATEGRSAWAKLLAIVLEIGSGAGLWLARGSGPKAQSEIASANEDHVKAEHPASEIAEHAAHETPSDPLPAAIGKRRRAVQKDRTINRSVVEFEREHP